MRLDCFPVSLTTWLDNWDAKADLDLVTDLANLANLLSPPEKAGNKKWEDKVSRRLLKLTRGAKCFSRAMQLCFVTFAVFLDGLFEGSDVSKRAKEKNDDISLIFYRRNLQKKPQGSAWQSKSRFSNGVYGSALIGENWQK